MQWTITPSTYIHVNKGIECLAKINGITCSDKIYTICSRITEEMNDETEKWYDTLSGMDQRRYDRQQLDAIKKLGNVTFM